MVNFGFIMADNSIIPPSPSRKDYTQREDYTVQMERNAAEIFDRDDPIALFSDWMVEARTHELNDSNAMALATADEAGLPDVRMVLLKGVDESGFVFYTNSESAKGGQVAQSGKAALCFHWKSLRRQVRIRGQVEQVTDAEADAYFESRARGSQIGAWASDQSRPAKSREEIEGKVKAAEARYADVPVPRPPHWFGWRVKPLQIEFWRDRPFRLHDRLLFRRSTLEDAWTSSRLYP